MQAEKADHQITQCHSTDDVESAFDVRRRKQTQDELDRVLRVAKAQLYHVHESTAHTQQRVIREIKLK